jgi:Zn-dependent M16 (insulinase) family peptidase
LVSVAKIQQSLPEAKRDGNNVLSSVCANLLYADNSTSRAGGVLPQTEFIPQLLQDLQTSPDKIIADFNELRKYREFSDLQVRLVISLFALVTDPSGIRMAVTGNVLGIKNPRSLWNKHFGKTISVSIWI